MPASNFEIIGRARGYELKENVVANKGFYCVPVGDRDDAPTTYPTPAQAWEHCCRYNHLHSAVKKVCGTCGGENVRLDAWASWSVEDQQYELHETYDNAFCVDCDGECTIKDVDVAEADLDDE